MERLAKLAQPLERAMAVEPALYVEGFGGCRLEDVVLVTEDGCRRLTQHPNDLRP